jgi:cobalt/nickel transport protein
MKIRYVVALVTVGLSASAAAAHYHLLLPDSPVTEKSVSLRLLFGHPYEHQLFDAVAPEKIGVIASDGSYRDLTSDLKKTSHKTPEGTEVTAFTLSCDLDKRGDAVFAAVSPAIWMKAEGRYYQDTVRVVVHHQSQIGWDRSLGKGFEMVPLTRPYGLQGGMVFQAQALLDGAPLAGAMVEVERFNETPPKELPPDPQITRLVKTDPSGIATCTLTDPGWWCVTARRNGGQREHVGKMRPVLQRSTFWVYVEGAGASAKGK